MRMRRLFEPYLVQIMSKLLERFGDVSAAVRAANDALARAVMANLSSQGVTKLHDIARDRTSGSPAHVFHGPVC